MTKARLRRRYRAAWRYLLRCQALGAGQAAFTRGYIRLLERVWEE